MVNMEFFVASKRQRRLDGVDKERLAYNSRVSRLKKTEYPMLKGITYLDHGGTTLASKSLMDSFSKAMRSNLLANPHSDASNPSVSSIIVADTRRRILQFFNADPEHFDIVFTANATAAVKVVMECFAGHNEGFDYYYHRNCHTSLVGVREMARRSHCLVSNEETEGWLSGGLELLAATNGDRPTLFAYPAQSNMSGERLPRAWSHQLRKSRNMEKTYTLLDAAALVSTSPLDLSNHTLAPDFTVLSFYKIFGFPDLGALIVRKASSHVLEHRRYFGGGTTELITCFGEKPWVARKEASLHSRLEDGTIAIRSILALQCAIDAHRKLFGGIEDISKHTSFLAKRLYDRLSVLKHASGLPVCHIYKASSSQYGDSETQGATIALNVRKSDGTWMGPYTMGAMLRAHNVHVRTGSFCNPAGMACALDLSPADIKRAYNEGFRCNQQDDIRQGGVLFGMIRVTLGAMSTIEDIERFAEFIEHNLVDRGETQGTNVGLDTLSSSISEGEKGQGSLEVVEAHGRPAHSRSRRFLARLRKSLRGCFSG